MLGLDVGALLRQHTPHILPPLGAKHVCWAFQKNHLTGDGLLTMNVRWESFLDPSSWFDTALPANVLSDNASTANTAQPVPRGEQVMAFPEVFVAANNDVIGMRPLRDIRWRARVNGGPVHGYDLQMPSGMQVGSESAGGYARQWHGAGPSTRPLFGIHVWTGQTLTIEVLDKTVAPIVGAQYMVYAIVRGWRWPIK